MPKFPMAKGVRSTVDTIRLRKDVPHKLRKQKVKLGDELTEVEDINPETTERVKRAKKAKKEKDPDR